MFTVERVVLNIVQNRENIEDSATWQKLQKAT